MSTLLFIIIGIIASKTMESCDVTMDMWQFWVMGACLVSSILVAIFLV